MFIVRYSGIVLKQLVGLTLSVMIAMALSLSVATGQDITWDGRHGPLEIGKKVFVFEDESGKLTVDQVSQQDFASNFKPSERAILNFGISESFFWLKFSFANQSGAPLWLEMAQPFLPVCDLYYRDATGTWQVSRSGYKVPIWEKAVKSHYQVYPLPPGRHDFYVRFQSFSPPTPIRIWQPGDHEVVADQQKLIYGLYAGVLLFVIINNLLLFFSFRRFSYVHYALVVLIYLSTTLAGLEGYLPYLFSQPDMLFWYRFIPEINMPVLWLYCVLFLEIKKYWPLAYRASLWILGYYLTMILVGAVAPVSFVLLINQINAVLLFAMIVWLGFGVQRRGNILGRYLAITYLVFCVFVIMEAVYIQTGKPAYLFGISHPSFAMLLEVFFLSYLLSKRFEWEKRAIEIERSEAQQQVLEKTVENEKIVREQNMVLERKVNERTAELNQSLTNLKTVQGQLIHAEKMASLGELTAGIAHEIQNPLNFVNNFSEVSSELLEELKAELEKRSDPNSDVEAEILSDLTENVQKITFHGKRADGIVKGMLEHSRAGTGTKEPTDINALANEYLRLAYHGLRAKDKHFNAELVSDFDQKIGKVNVVAQDLGRVLLNLINNAFYAVHERKQADGTFKPRVSVQTFLVDRAVVIRISDNGIGISEGIRQKIFQPFFSTKPTGQGTGLGLSLSYEIVVKGHQGKLEVESEPGNGSVFIVTLPV